MYSGGPLVYNFIPLTICVTGKGDPQKTFYFFTRRLFDQIANYKPNPTPQKEGKPSECITFELYSKPSDTVDAVNEKVWIISSFVTCLVVNQTFENVTTFSYIFVILFLRFFVCFMF